jgi:hypothetical protein
VTRAILVIFASLPCLAMSLLTLAFAIGTALFTARVLWLWLELLRE